MLNVKRSMLAIQQIMESAFPALITANPTLPFVFHMRIIIDGVTARLAQISIRRDYVMRFWPAVYYRDQ